jgi:hypothetical protein
VHHQHPAKFDRAAHRAPGVAAVGLRQAEHHRHLGAVRSQRLAAELARKGCDVGQNLAARFGRACQRDVQLDYVAHRFPRRRAGRGGKRRGGSDRACHQLVDLDFEDGRQVARGSVQHHLAGLRALDRGDRYRQLLVDAQFGQRFLAQAARLAQRLEQRRVECDAAVRRGAFGGRKEWLIRAHGGATIAPPAGADRLSRCRRRPAAAA